MNLLLQSVNLTSVLTVLAIVAVLAIVFSILILIINKLCHVEVDPKIEQVQEKLAGANCGGCGYAGCADFAKAVVEGKANICDCAATSAENKQAITKIVGGVACVDMPMKAVVKCAGTPELTTKKFDYIGINTCEAKNAMQGGEKLCPSGCLGEGACALACKFNAMSVNNGVAECKQDNCSACRACINVCPKGIIELIPKNAKVYVACSSKCKGKEVISACKVGCIGCGLCVKACPNGAISLIDNLAVINYNACTGCGACADKCTRKCIVKF